MCFRFTLSVLRPTFRFMRPLATMVARPNRDVPCDAHRRYLRPAGAGAWIQGVVAWSVLAFLPLTFTPAWSSAVSGSPVDPANMSWSPLHQAIREAQAQQARRSTGSFTAADGAADDQFGYSVALDGDTALVGVYLDDVGANSDQGSVYVFIRSGASWTQQAKLTAGDGAANDGFGWSVALDGDTALVGVSWGDVGSNRHQGSAYVFTRNGSSWTQQAKLTAGDGAAFDRFGVSVALNDDTALVGAYLDGVDANSRQGSAYVFTRCGSSWTQQAKLTAGDGAAHDQFGVSVALDGETALVGAYYDDVGANSNQGSAYVFTRSGSSWTPQAKLTADDGLESDLFGWSVAVDGDTALVGAVTDDVGTNSSQGSAYVFTRSGSSWTQQAKLTAGDGAVDDEFGHSVALDGDTAMVGARFDDVGANFNQGAVNVFARVGLNWTEQAKLTARDGKRIDIFGKSVALDGDTAVVGAYSDDVGVNSDQGSAYVFIRSGSSWTQHW